MSIIYTEWSDDMNPLLAAIKQSDPNELSLIIQAIVFRYKELYPDWEVFFLSLPINNTEERRKIIESAFEMTNGS